MVRTNTFVPDVFDFFTLNEARNIEIVIVLEQDKTRQDKKASCRM